MGQAQGGSSCRASALRAWAGAGDKGTCPGGVPLCLWATAKMWCVAVAVTEAAAGLGAVSCFVSVEFSLQNKQQKRKLSCPVLGVWGHRLPGPGPWACAWGAPEQAVLTPQGCPLGA